MKNFIYAIVMVMSAMLATTFTSCDSDANILQTDETIGLYTGSVTIDWYALKDGVKYDGKEFEKGDILDRFYYKQVDGDTCMMFLGISNTGAASLALSIPSEPYSETVSDYFMVIEDLPVTELGNRVATIGVKEISFGDNKFNSKTLFQPYKNADFDYVEDGKTKTEPVSGEAAFICGNYQLVSQITIVKVNSLEMDGIGISIVFDGWLASGKDSNDLIKRRNKR